MKNISDAIKLAEKMVAIGENYGKKTIALITNMDIPLGKNIGNSLEIKEVVDALKGNAPKDLFEICIKLAGNMLYLANKGTLEECENMAISTINSGKAFEKFIEMVKFQGGDIELIKNPEKFEKSKFKKTILSTKDGFISKIDTENLGIISTILGAGRNTKDDKIDFSAGIILEKKVGDFVKKGEILAYLFSSKENKIKLAEVKFLNSIHFDDNMPEIRPFILDRIEKV